MREFLLHSQVQRLLKLAFDKALSLLFAEKLAYKHETRSLTLFCICISGFLLFLIIFSVTMLHFLNLVYHKGLHAQHYQRTFVLRQHYRQRSSEYSWNHKVVNRVAK